MTSTTVISPVTRLEGHLGIRLEVNDGRVTDAFCSGEMFRGFEIILKGSLSTGSALPARRQNLVQLFIYKWHVTHKEYNQTGRNPLPPLYILHPHLLP